MNLCVAPAVQFYSLHGEMYRDKVTDAKASSGTSAHTATPSCAPCRHEMCLGALLRHGAASASPQSGGKRRSSPGGWGSARWVISPVRAGVHDAPHPARHQAQAREGGCRLPRC